MPPIPIFFIFSALTLPKVTLVFNYHNKCLFNFFFFFFFKLPPLPQPLYTKRLKYKQAPIQGTIRLFFNGNILTLKNRHYGLKYSWRAFFYLKRKQPTPGTRILKFRPKFLTKLFYYSWFVRQQRVLKLNLTTIFTLPTTLWQNLWFCF